MNGNAFITFPCPHPTNFLLSIPFSVFFFHFLPLWRLFCSKLLCFSPCVLSPTSTSQEDKASPSSSFIRPLALPSPRCRSAQLSSRSSL
jgi:hypothetical protein